MSLRPSAPPPKKEKPRVSPWLLLGRVSNLPTVWSNTLAGIALATAAQASSGVAMTAPGAAHVLSLALSLSLLYVGGMYLNDAFDRAFDAVHRPERPIPSGVVSARAVLTLGFAMLGLGIAIAGAAGFARTQSPAAGIAATALAGVVVLYDLRHKGNPLSPVLMGMCRALVYATAALATYSSFSPGLIIASIALLGYLIGLTYIAKHETGGSVVALWPLVPLALPVLHGALAPGLAPNALALALLAHTALNLRLVLLPAHRNVPKAVSQLIAGISLVDAIAIAATGFPELSLLAIAAFSLTRIFQRVVPGT
jgi:4-hydroxybenzoate polyprenyltransferase